MKTPFYLKSSRHILWFFCLCVLIAIPTAYGQTQVSVKQNNTAVKSEPRFNSQTLVTLRAGSRILVKGRNGDWFKVGFRQSGFEFTGWVEKSAFMTRGRSQTPPPQQGNLDGFFDTSGAFEPFGSTQASSEPKRNDRSRKKSSQSEPRSNFKSRNGSFADVWLRDRLKLSGILGFTLLNHKVTGTGTEQGFSYNLSGANLGFLVGYDYWFSANQKYIAGVEFGFEHTIFVSKTDLKDSGGNTFNTRKSNNSANTINLNATLLYAMGTRLSLGALLGLKLFSFKGDDIVDNSGNPLNLYVDSKLTTFPMGLMAIYNTDTYEFAFKLNAWLAGSYSESPAGATGTAPSAGLGINPVLSIMYKFKPNHRLGATYELMMQTIQYSGSATRILLPVTNGSTKNTVHVLGLNYRYAF